VVYDYSVVSGVDDTLASWQRSVPAVASMGDHRLYWRFLKLFSAAHTSSTLETHL